MIDYGRERLLSEKREFELTLLRQRVLISAA